MESTSCLKYIQIFYKTMYAIYRTHPAICIQNHLLMELLLMNFYRFVVNIMRCILPLFFPRFGEVQGFWLSCCWACFIQLHSDQGAQGYLCPCSLPFWRGSCNMKNKEAYAFKVLLLRCKLHIKIDDYNVSLKIACSCFLKIKS